MDRDFIVNVNPRVPLLTVSNRTTRARLKNRQHFFKRAAVRTEDKSRADDRNAHVDIVRALRLVLPRCADTGKKIIARRAGFGERCIEASAVVANSGGRDEGLRPVWMCCEVLDQRARGVAAACGNALFHVGVPTPPGDRLAREIDEHIVPAR